jgi:hypothetical protein
VVQAVLTGEVVNNTSDSVRLPKLFVRLRDVDEDIPVQTAGGLATLIRIPIPILRPGEASPFSVCGATGYNVTDFEVKVQDYKRTVDELFWDIDVTESHGSVHVFDPPLEKRRCLQQFELSKGYTVTGKVKNSGNRVARFVQVVATFYDDKGGVVDVDEYSLIETHLPPGEEASFIVRSLVPPELVSDFKIQVVAK